jgi:hypothetical protein
MGPQITQSLVVPLSAGMSLHGFPSLASEPSGLPPLPPGWSGSSPAPSNYQLPPVPPESNGWGSSPTVATQHRAEDTFAQPFTLSPPSHNGYNTPIIKPLFIDTLARDMKLEEGQKQNLHDFVQVCPSVVFMECGPANTCHSLALRPLA